MKEQDLFKDVIERAFPFYDREYELGALATFDYICQSLPLEFDEEGVQINASSGARITKTTSGPALYKCRGYGFTTGIFSPIHI